MADQPIVNLTRQSRPPANSRRRRHWLALGLRIARLMIRPAEPMADLVRASYDRIAGGYDQAWTNHMRGLSLDMLDRLSVRPGRRCLDLTCGTGFVTGELARRSGRQAVGVDASIGMLQVARAGHGQTCQFVQADVIEYLRATPPARFDVITCAWGLGYTRPWTVIRQIARVLRPGGRVGIIDNSLLSLAGVLWSAMRTFAESPDSLSHVMNFRFLPGRAVLAAMMRASGLAVRCAYGGAKTYLADDGRSAIARLTATGAAAGFEFAARPRDHDAIFSRFAQILDDRHRTARGVPITHRYLAAVGQKRWS